MSFAVAVVTALEQYEFDEERGFYRLVSRASIASSLPIATGGLSVSLM
ncbi:hypothetical protein FNYG_02351 [Fusarium nygamai]|uniref:Uncharacterized protein n=1 Tax=Gibberella nygamai TaxID=42673 RepID=A0A2K0WPW7_GIBNY|nr:hypothetical protein FNYG_02351 [Fusarium nygamai]